MLSETQWLWNNTIHMSLQNLHCICSDYGVRLLIWYRHMLKEMHKIGPLDKAGVHKVLIKLKCNLGISFNAPVTCMPLIICTVYCQFSYQV